MINVQTEHLEKHVARLTVEVEPERIDQAVRQAARKISQKARIPGFRPGKAPFQIVLNTFGYEYILSEALETIGTDVYKEALEASGVDPYTSGSLVEVRDEGKVLVFEVPKRPTVDLGDYRAIRADDELEPVTDEILTNALEGLREREALIEEAQRPAQLEDLVTFGHFQVSVLLPDEEQKDAQVSDDDDEDQDAEDLDDRDDDEDEDLDDELDEQIVLHEHDFKAVLRDDPQRDLFPGFSAEIVGAVAGDDLEFYLTLPDDFEDKRFAGRTLRVQAEITKVELRILPEWSDALASRLSDGKVDTLLALRMDVRQNLEKQAQERSEQRLAFKVLEQMVANATFAYPDELIEETLDDLVSEIEQEVFTPQGLKLQDYLRIVGQSEEDFRNERRPAAIARIERRLTLGEFVHQEGLDADDPAIDQRIEAMVAAIDKGDPALFRRFFNLERSREQIRSQITWERTVKRLAAIARGETPPRGWQDLAPAEATAAAEASLAPADDQAEPNATV